MARHDDVAAATCDAGFEFARRLRDPEVREVLKRLNWKSGQHVVVAVDSEPVIDVVTRIQFHETGGRALIASPDERESCGFRFLLVEVGHEAVEGAEQLQLGPGANLGMLYAALEPCGTYMPSEWYQPLLFERVTSGS